MTSYLVTGGKGQLGQCFQAVAKSFPEIELFFADRKEVDLRKPQKLADYHQNTPFDGIINCAAYTAVDQAESEGEKAFAVNGQGVKNLVAFCEQHQLKLVHFSTDYVFDGTLENPYIETDLPHPLSVYGKSKYEGEQHIQEANFPHTSLRISWLFSPFGHNFVQTIRSLCQTKEEIKVVNDQWGRPTYGLDVAQTVLEQLSNPHFFEYSCYHFANQGVTSWFEWAQEISKQTTGECKVVPCTTAEYPTPAKRPQYAVLDTTRIEKHLSLTPASWQEALERCLKKMQ
jgi:dTDP-4-dehydrorhamnose reductase